ncbi:hypothetical protein TPHA_0E04010 [Tetrapisispora phaffii CBS 4417]|uniref:DNA replication checkpoint mediator MRC1 domain-containing protein n=1 Tax=Tetrapisispora phaffii (strain ATCC 24235 / CBS 4417 / NBRC 1672 / NRRL Y-8282 / UCD 70-5) TaxID=1071381 RepID=G8BUB2_TETPH|nr:hypothetical protein TPHA_0E04010 [Tetrapisispora phaffii CBS 4417]CCE63490.1 hypothetical protein TPHA_0E04010 [Tetrapisispora phaffii CBS 4417]
MDSLFDQLNHFKKKRTTYDKIPHDLLEEEQESEDILKNKTAKEISQLDGGILFGNSILGQIRNRLNNIDNEDKDKGKEASESITSKDNEQDSTQIFPQTQIINNLYDGGEDLENEIFHNSFKKTQIITDNILIETNTNDKSTQYEKTQVITINERLSDKPLDVVNNTQTVLVIENTQPLPSEIKTQVVNEVNSALPVTQPTQTIVATQANEVTYDTQELMPTVDDVAMRSTGLKITDIEKELEEEQRLAKETEFGTEFKFKESESKISKKFSKEDFLNHFDDSSSSEDETSKNEKGPNVDKSEVLHPDNKSKTLLKVKSINGLGNYEHNLRRKANNEQIIEFSESDEDSDTNISPSYASKAVILNIRANKSKQQPKVSQKSDQTTLLMLYNNLKRASKEQIVSYQKELMEKKGINLEELEKENEIVENLLEQEIARNQKIRQREKQKQKKENQDDLNSNPEEFDLSANELEDSDIPGSDFAESNNNSEKDDEEEENDEEEEDEQEDAPKSTVDEEDEGFAIGKRKHKKTEIVDDSDSEIEAQIVDSKEIITANTIDLGHYGDNIIQQSRETLNETEESDEEDEERYNAIISEGIRKQKELEKREAKRLKEMKTSGVSKMFEVEAEESEDEWHGIGGVDSDFSDAYDSEVEKMIDDYSRQNFNPSEIREMLAKENKETDLALVNKILYDIKNGGFRTRKRRDRDLEFSDDDDDDLKAYRAKRRALMREKRLDIEGDKKIVKNPKSKAFFESIVDDIIETKNPFDDMNTSIEQIVEKETPTVDIDNDEKLATNVTKKKKKIVISEEFVQRSLSFLNSCREQDEFEINNQHNGGEKATSTADLYTLKRYSSIKTLQSVTSSRSSSIASNLNEQPSQSSGSLFNDLRKTSVLNSFSSDVDINSKFKEGTKSVKVSNAYKTVGSARASITYMGTSRRLVAPKKSRLTTSSKANSRTTPSRLFDNQEGSFE